jgi:low affinity Fe/Cu permease
MHLYFPDIFTLETEIDEMVYALCGLTPEEIATVEGKKALMLSNMSKYLYNIMQGRRLVK